VNRIIAALVLLIAGILGVGCSGGGGGTTAGSGGGGGGNVSVPVTLQSITVTPVDPTYPVGIPTQFSATGTYTDGTTHDLGTAITWSSTATSPSVGTIATIDATGIATGVTPGWSTITAASGVVTASTALFVNQDRLTSITVTPANPNMYIGQPKQFKATGTYWNGAYDTTYDISTVATWTSSMPTAATIDSKGLASGVSAGTSTITVTFGGFTASTISTVTTFPTLPTGYFVQGGIIWMPVNSTTYTRDAANSYCTTSTINGQTGWRLPTDVELSSLYASGAAKGQGWTLGNTWSSDSNYVSYPGSYSYVGIPGCTYMYFTGPYVGSCAPPFGYTVYHFTNLSTGGTGTDGSNYMTCVR
jgi:hypothetical protein